MNSLPLGTDAVIGREGARVPLLSASNVKAVPPLEKTLVLDCVFFSQLIKPLLSVAVVPLEPPLEDTRYDLACS